MKFNMIRTIHLSTSLPCTLEEEESSNCTASLEEGNVFHSAPSETGPTSISFGILSVCLSRELVLNAYHHKPSKPKVINEKASQLNTQKTRMMKTDRVSLYFLLLLWYYCLIYLFWVLRVGGC